MRLELQLEDWTDLSIGEKILIGAADGLEEDVEDGFKDGGELGDELGKVDVAPEG